MSDNPASAPPSERARIVLIGGGVRSGKSGFALALDAEMTRRIADHARTRGDDFRTLEEPLALPETLLAIRDADVVVVDCLTLWLSNLLLRESPDEEIEARLEALADALEWRAFHAVIVSNEVGMGLVPESSLGRRFRDLAGRAHQRLAAIADEIYFGAMGTLLRLRPAPIALQPAPPPAASR
jgi:adenosylcobinamide kinase/adenosylcobinamide-phosphate guanylyltransferase